MCIWPPGFRAEGLCVGLRGEYECVELKSWEHVVRLDSGAGGGGGVRAHLLAAVAVVHAEEGGIVVES